MFHHLKKTIVRMHHGYVISILDIFFLTTKIQPLLYGDAADSQLEKLKKQQAKITARIQLMEAREKTAERKKETRRKILVGAYYLDQAALNNQFDDIKKLLAGYLKRNSDRKLFNLPALEEEKIEAALPA